MDVKCFAVRKASTYGTNYVKRLQQQGAELGQCPGSIFGRDQSKS